MGGYSQPLSESLGLPQDLAGPMRRRGLIPALMQTQPEQAAGTDRVADEPVTRNNPEAYGATSSGQTPTSTSPTNPLTEKMWEEYNKLGQPEPQAPPPSLKDRLLQGLLRAAPIAAGALAGGTYGAAGAAQGEGQAINRQQGVRLAQQQMAQQHQQQRDSLRERMLQEILQQQRMQQQNEQFQQHNAELEKLMTQKGQNAMDVQQLKGAQGSALETQKQGGREELQQEKTGGKTPTEWEVFMSGEQGKTPQQIVQDYARFKQPPQREPSITVVVPNAEGGGTVERLRPGQQVAPGAMSPTQFGAQGPQQEKAIKPYQNIIDEAQTAHTLADMGQRGNAPADVDLALSFFKTIRGTGSSIRFTGQEQKLILGARGATDAMTAVAQKVIGEGQKLTDDQRNKMIQVIDVHARAAQSAIDRIRGPQGAQRGGGQQQGQPLTVDEARQYLQRAGGDKDKARALARQEGRTF